MDFLSVTHVKPNGMINNNEVGVHFLMKNAYPSQTAHSRAQGQQLIKSDIK
jgi:hypothetical protein